MSSRASYCSYGYRLLQTYIYRGTKIGKRGPVLIAKTGLAGLAWLILAAKVVQGTNFSKFSANICLAKPILVWQDLY